MTPGGGRLEERVAPTPPVSGVKHGLEPVGPPLSKLAKTGGLDTEPGREPVQLSPDDSKALDFDEPKIKAILGKQRSPSGRTRYLVKWDHMPSRSFVACCPGGEEFLSSARSVAGVSSPLRRPRSTATRTIHRLPGSSPLAVFALR